MDWDEVGNVPQEEAIKMLDHEAFRKRANRLFDDNRTRYRKVLHKAFVKAKLPPTAMPSPDKILPFTRAQFTKWLWDQMGLQVSLCPYFREPIDILTMELDHRTPLRRGGGPELSNLQCICKRANQVKGEFTHEEFLVIVAFFDGPAAYFRSRLEGVMISGGVGKVMKHFPRAKKGDKPVAEPVLEFENF